MAKDLPVTLDGNVIYHIKLTDSFQGLEDELKQLGYQADQKICIITDSNVAKLYAETVKNIGICNNTDFLVCLISKLL